MNKYIFFCFLFLVSCSTEGPFNDTLNKPELTEALNTESEGDQNNSNSKKCGIEDDSYICEIIEIEDTQFIDEQAFVWTPDINGLELEAKIVFKNGMDSTFFTVVDRGHYFLRENVSINCDEPGTFDLSSTIICQENEIIFVSFLNDLLGTDTITMQLRTMTVSYEEQNPGDKENIVSLYQDKSNSDDRNYWLRHFIGEDYYERISTSFKERILLNGKEYEDVLEYRLDAHVNTNPENRYYMQEGLGILGFEVDGKLWLRD